MFSTIWAKLAALFGGILALLGIIAGAWYKGREGAEKTAKLEAQATQAKEVKQAAVVEHQTQQAAQAAIQAVQEEAAKQPAPDVKAREDLNDTF